MVCQDSQENYALEKVVRNLIKNVKEQKDLGINQVVYHKEFYEGKQ
jgi:endonuclease IV